MTAAEMTQLITAVTIVPAAFLGGLLMTYLAANIEQIKHQWRTRRRG